MPSPSFDPDAFMASRQASFDPDAFMASRGEKPGALSRFGSGLYESTIGGLVELIHHPIDSVSAAAKQAIGVDDLKAIADHVSKGEFGPAAVAALKYASEGPGERIAKASMVDPVAEDVHEGNYASAAGRVLGTGISLAAPEVIPPAARAVGRMAEATGAADKLSQAAAATRAGATALGDSFDLTKPLTAIKAPFALSDALRAAVDAWKDASPEGRAGAARMDYLDAVSKETMKGKSFDKLNRTQQAQVIDYADKLPELARQEMQDSRGVTPGTLPAAPESSAVRGPVRPPLGQPAGTPAPAAPAPAAPPAAMPQPAAAVDPAQIGARQPAPNNLDSIARQAQASTLEPTPPPAGSAPATEPPSPMATNPDARAIAQQLFEEAKKNGTVPEGTKPGEQFGGAETQNPEGFQQRARAGRATDAETIAGHLHQSGITTSRLGNVTLPEWRATLEASGFKFPETTVALRKLVFEVTKRLQGMEAAQ